MSLTKELTKIGTENGPCISLTLSGDSPDVEKAFGRLVDHAEGVEGWSKRSVLTTPARWGEEGLSRSITMPMTKPLFRALSLFLSE